VARLRTMVPWCRIEVAGELEMRPATLQRRWGWSLAEEQRSEVTYQHDMAVDAGGREGEGHCTPHHLMRAICTSPMEVVLGNTPLSVVPPGPKPLYKLFRHEIQSKRIVEELQISTGLK
jgi:hypothetical protein